MEGQILVLTPSPSLTGFWPIWINVYLHYGHALVAVAKVSPYSKAIELQREIAKKVQTENSFSKPIERVCGVDVSYKKDMAYSSSVIVKKQNLKVIEEANCKSAINWPYVPGLFMLRESGPAIKAIRELKNRFDLLLVDGHGILHPRRCGLASYLGVTLDVPSIGVAKSILCGKVMEDNFIKYGQEILGFRLENRQKKKSVYVSVGHKIDLATAITITSELIKNGEWIPEPLRIADTNSKDHVKFA